MSSEIQQSEVNSQVKNELPKPSKRFKPKYMIMIIDHTLISFTFDLLLCTIIVLSNILECTGAFESVWWLNLEVRCHICFAYIAIRCLFVIGFTAFKKKSKQTDSTV
ncbi:hypothetical protein M3Y96_01204400 [Aphelenchoides besseyi]|nr:hypothetical protein M3Y96_01204400 [Aphelenchoides besseyi]